MPLALIADMLRTAAFLLLAAVVSTSHVTAGAACIPDWSIAAPIVLQEKLVSVETLSRIVADKVSGSSIVRTTLCKENGAFFYRVVMRDSRGRLFVRSVDARAPFGR